MGYEQINSKAASKKREEVEKEAKEEILKNQIKVFIDENGEEVDKILKDKGEVGMLDIEGLARKFIPGAGNEEISSARTMIAKVLSERGKPLSGAVVRSELQGKDSFDFVRSVEKSETGQKADMPSQTPDRSEANSNKDETDEEDSGEARRKLPPQQRGLPTGDL